MGRVPERGWVRSMTAGAGADVRLVCFPHSGGSAISFGEWGAALPAGVSLLGVQYPGRGDRFREPLVDRVAEMADRVAAELLRGTPQRRVLFGHSLGALVAHETALLLRDAGQQPLALCVSAAMPPGLIRDGELHRAPDDEFWAALCALGGIEPAVAANVELRDVLLPAIRSDLRAHATHRPRPDVRPLSCPVRCYHGEGDPLVDRTALAAWADVTTGAFSRLDRPGGHFHLATDVEELVADVLNQGREVRLP
ncbi:thioesterase II family protein [Kitasatospora sp. NPDC004531]